MKKILVVPELHSLLPSDLCEQLESEGFSVEKKALYPDSCVETVQLIQPDVILLEIQADEPQPRYDLCQQLNTQTSTDSIPILLVGKEPSTHNGCHNYLTQGLNIGASDVIYLSEQFSHLLPKVSMALKLKAALDKALVLSEQLNSLNEELYQRSVHVEKELYIARQLQQSLLPKALKLVDENDDMAPMYTKIHYQDEKLRVSGIYFPCDALGGDLYDVLKLHDNALGVSITDVSGHGVPAGFITAIVKTSISRITHQISDPAEVLFHLNNELYNIVKTGDYVTGIYLRIDLETMTLECAGAGHPYPFYYESQTQTMHRLKKNATPLVWVPDMDYPKDTLTLRPGDKIYLFTDGVSEIKNHDQAMYGEDTLEKTLLEAINNQAPYITDEIIGKLSDFTEGAPLEDDISMVLIEAL